LQSSEYREQTTSWIQPNDSQDFLIELDWIENAEATGGRVLVPTHLTDVAAEYGKIARELGTSYSLGYAPSTASDGKNHRIEVRVRRPGLVVSQSRDSYQR
jgi:hypothetical protein